MSKQRIDTTTEFSASSEGLSLYATSGSASFSALSIFDNPSNLIQINTDGSISSQELEVIGGVVLGTHTVGNYVGSIVNGTGISSTSLPNTTISIGQAVSTSDSVTFGTLETTSNSVINGNLTVTGTYTRIDTSTVSINDNIVLLNADHSGSPTDDVGVEIERGNVSNVSIKWNETSDKWEYTNDGTNFYEIPVESNLDSLSDVTITSLQTGDVLTYSGSVWINQAPSSSGFDAGTVLMYVSPTPPSGWLLCDGSEVSQSTYADLYTAIGSTYNDGNETVGNFRLPNFIDSIPYGDATSADIPEQTAIASNSTYHSHTANISTETFSHDHVNASTSAVSIPAHTHSITTGSGGDTPHTHPATDSLTGIDANIPHGDGPFQHAGSYGGENANHAHYSGIDNANQSGSGGTHSARHNPPNTLRNSGTGGNHDHTPGGYSCGTADANHSHTGNTSNVPGGMSHPHPTTVNASNTGSHPFTVNTVSHSHGTFTMSPDESNSHSHTSTTENQSIDHTHSITAVPVFYIIKS